LVRERVCEGMILMMADGNRGVHTIGTTKKRITTPHISSLDSRPLITILKDFIFTLFVLN